MSVTIAAQLLDGFDLPEGDDFALNANEATLALAYSQAVSLKRIADALGRIDVHLVNAAQSPTHPTEGKNT
jgi:hypothetical protein